MLETKYLVAGGVGIAVVIGGLIWATSASADDGMLKMKLDADKKKFYDKGFKEGVAQGTADRGKAHDPIVTVNEAEDTLTKAAAAAKATLPGAAYIADVQKAYENGVNDGYDRHWTGLVPVVEETSFPPTPKEGGMRPGWTAYDYGRIRGKSRGHADGLSTGDGSLTPDDYLVSDGSKQRQMESGNPAEYRRGYKDGYYAGLAGGIAEKAAIDVFSAGVPSKPLLAVGSLLSVGYDSRTGDVLNVAGILSVGFEPESGTVLKVAGARVLGVRRAYAPRIVRRIVNPGPPETPPLESSFFDRPPPGGESGESPIREFGPKHRG